MNTKKICATLALLLVALVPFAINADDEIVGDQDIIARLSAIDPKIAATKFLANEADARKTQAQSRYYPTLELQMLEPVPGSYPGSNGHSQSGIHGLMQSPFHVGFAAGFATDFTLYDFGRTSNSVKAAEQDRLTAEIMAKIERIEVVQRGLNIFYNAVKFRELQKLWSEEQKELQNIEREINRFVRTGQKSIVDRHIIRSQVEDVERESFEFADQYQSGKKVIGNFLMADAATLQLVAIEKIQPESAGYAVDEANSPYVQRLRSEKASAEYGVARAKADHLPNLVAFGTAGYMQGTRLVDMSNWAVGFAATLPLFQGFRVQGQVKEAEAKVARLKKELEAIAMRIHETNLQLEQGIQTTRDNIERLKTELKTARAGLITAKQRYRTFEGNLRDVRDTIATYYHTRGLQIEAQLRLAYLLKIHALTNGAL
ncbi:MAG: TolC family protein [Spirochaetes bacterium]|nr:TolC family protein [Spirochaetota bacterium]